MKIEEMNWDLDELRRLHEYLKEKALTVDSLIDDYEAFLYADAIR